MFKSLDYAEEFSRKQNRKIHVSSLSPLEKFVDFHAGILDGKKNAAVRNKEGSYTTPRIEMMVSELQQDDLQHYAEFTRLQKTASQKLKELEAHRSQLEKEIEDVTEEQLAQRRTGEDSLTEEQVHARRRRELIGKKPEELQECITEIEKLQTSRDALHADMLMITPMRFMHSAARIQKYWDGVRKGSGNSDLPASPNFTISLPGQYLYYLTHASDSIFDRSDLEAASTMTFRDACRFTSMTENVRQGE